MEGRGKGRRRENVGDGEKVGGDGEMEGRERRRE